MEYTEDKKKELEIIIGIELTDGEMKYLSEKWSAFYETPWLYNNCADMMKNTLLERREIYG